METFSKITEAVSSIFLIIMDRTRQIPVMRAP